MGGVSEAIGLETGVQASETLLKDNAERREKVKKAKQVVENDILANPESNIEQYDFLTEEINKLEEEYRNKPYSPSMDEKLKELNAQKDVMAPGVEKVKSANWFKVNVLDATEETAIYQPTGSIEDSETGEDLGVSIGTEDDVYLATYKKFLEDTNPKVLEEHYEKINTLKERGSTKLLEDAESKFEIQANNWYNQQINTSLELAKLKRRFDPETGEEYTLQEKLDESDALRVQNQELEEDLLDLDKKIKDKIKNSGS